MQVDVANKGEPDDEGRLTAQHSLNSLTTKFQRSWRTHCASVLPKCLDPLKWDFPPSKNQPRFINLLIKLKTPPRMRQLAGAPKVCCPLGFPGGNVGMNPGFGPLKGNQKVWFVGVIPSFPTEHQQVSHVSLQNPEKYALRRHAHFEATSAG